MMTMLGLFQEWKTDTEMYERSDLTSWRATREPQPGLSHDPKIQIQYIDQRKFPA